VWSLSVEEQFYVCWPLLVVVLSPRRALWLVAGYLVAAPVVRLVMAFGFDGTLDLIEFLTPLHLDSIAAGCLLALAADWPAFRERALVDPARASLATAAAAAIIVLSYVTSYFISIFDVTLHYSLVAAASAVIIWTVAINPATALGRVLVTRPAVLVGVLAYSLYLWQEIFLSRAPHWWTAWPQNIVLAVLAAVASYYVVESPFLRIKDRASRPAQPTRSAAVPERDRPHPAPVSVTVG
jgi:peptidoglycan/LPS O-acetylase OafA/YrhL